MVLIAKVVDYVGQNRHDGPTTDQEKMKGILW